MEEGNQSGDLAISGGLVDMATLKKSMPREEEERLGLCYDRQCKTAKSIQWSSKLEAFMSSALVGIKVVNSEGAVSQLSGLTPSFIGACFQCSLHAGPTVSKDETKIISSNDVYVSF